MSTDDENEKEEDTSKLSENQDQTADINENENADAQASEDKDIEDISANDIVIEEKSPDTDDITGGIDITDDDSDSGEEYKWFIKKDDDWAPVSEDDQTLTLFLAKQALSMPKNTTDNISLNITPEATIEGAKLNVSVVGTITKGNTENSADLLFELADTTAAGATNGSYRIKAYFTNVGGDSFFHWKLYDIESIRTPTSPAPSSGGAEGGTP